jgi:multisubunit Na+/H+ antiporter MnhB subunit
MTIETVLDLGVAALVVAVAAWTVAARRTFPAAVGYIVYGLLLAFAWVRLDAVDVALTEAAVGGLTGVLLLGAARSLPAQEADPRGEQPSAALRSAAALLCVLVTAGLATAVLTLPDPAPTLAPDAVAHLTDTEVGNPVTAVLMAYRAIDTLVEKIVVMVALLGVWSLAPDRMWGGRPGTGERAPADRAIGFLARMLAPIGIVIGVYLVWTSADNPGGAFPGSTLIAAMWVLLRMAGVVDAPAIGGRRLRIALAAGPVVFLTIGLAGFAWADGFLAYPTGFAKSLILGIEAGMLLSIAVTLAMLVDGPPQRAVAEPRAQATRPAP